MNRQQRRKIERQNRKITRPAYKGMTREQRMDALVKNGITAEDLKNEWHDGFEAGFREACPATVRTLYAAVLLAAHDVYRFGQQRAVRLLNAVDRHMVNTLCSQDAIDQVFDTLGVTLQFEDPTESTVQVEVENKPWRVKK